MPIIGDKSLFAIEYQRTDCFDHNEGRKLGVLGGLFCYWVANLPIGSFEDIIDLPLVKKYMKEFIEVKNYRYLDGSECMLKKELFCIFGYIMGSSLGWKTLAPYITKANRLERKIEKKVGTKVFRTAFDLASIGNCEMSDTVSIFLVNEYDKIYPRQRLVYHMQDGAMNRKRIIEQFLPKDCVDKCAVEFIRQINIIQNETLEEKKEAWRVQEYLYPATDQLPPQLLAELVDKQEPKSIPISDDMASFEFYYSQELGVFIRYYVDQLGFKHYAGKNDGDYAFTVPDEVKEHFGVAE